MIREVESNLDADNVADVLSILVKMCAESCEKEP